MLHRTLFVCLAGASLLTPSADAVELSMKPTNLCLTAEYKDKKACQDRLAEQSNTSKEFGLNTGHESIIPEDWREWIEVTDAGRGLAVLVDVDTDETLGEVWLAEGDSYTELWVGDFNGDRIEDLALVSEDGDVWMIDGTFDARPTGRFSL